jgi:hypothetical protein
VKKASKALNYSIKKEANRLEGLEPNRFAERINLPYRADCVGKANLFLKTSVGRFGDQGR